MTTLTINGNNYVAKEFDFNLVCDLEDLGVSINESRRKPVAMVRAYVALCMNAPLDYAGKELEAHLVNGGNIEKIMEVMNEKMESSDFFRSLGETTEKETPKAQTSRKTNTKA